MLFLSVKFINEIAKCSRFMGRYKSFFESESVKIRASKLAH
ncbi:hypothetical protein PUND_a0913 [Pseudoalteromonas undina]|nr:hypothetical protein PUND_a0913 [Pseudoalteromonas undina]